MNDESLEQHLRNLPAPELPEAWHAPILSTALREARASSRAQREWPSLLIYLDNLFRRNPTTSSAMAALWMLIFIFKTTTPVDPASKMLLARVDPHRPIYLTSISEEIRFVQLFQDEPERKQIP